MSKPKKSKAVKATEPKLSYWAEYYRKNKAKYAAWGKAWREKQKALKAVNVTAAEEPAPKTKCSKKKSKAPTS